MQHKCCCHGCRPPRVRASDWAHTTNPGHFVPGTPSPTTTPPLRAWQLLTTRPLVRIGRPRRTRRPPLIVEAPTPSLQWCIPRWSTSLAGRKVRSAMTTTDVPPLQVVRYTLRVAAPDAGLVIREVWLLRLRSGRGGRRTRRASQSRIIPTNSKRSGVSFADSQSLTASSPIW